METFQLSRKTSSEKRFELVRARLRMASVSVDESERARWNAVANSSADRAWKPVMIVSELGAKSDWKISVTYQ